MQLLRSKLFELEQEKQAAEIKEQRLMQVGTGGRSEKIRTYNLVCSAWPAVASELFAGRLEYKQEWPWPCSHSTNGSLNTRW